MYNVTNLNVGVKMAQVTFKKLDDIKKLQIGKELPISEYADPDRGFLELKSFGPNVYKNGKTIFDGLTYDVDLIVTDIEVYKQQSACIYVDVIIKKKEKPNIASGALICVLEG